MTVTRKWEAVLPAAVGGAIGASLAQLLEELSLKSKPTLLAGMVEGPLLLFGGSSHSVIGTALLDALLLFVVWQGMRDRRWLGLATVAVVVNLANVGVAIDLDWASISRIGARYSSPSPLRVFTHHSPEGFVVLAFGAFGWHVFLEGCLIHAWTRPATFSTAVCEEPLTRPSAPLVRLVRDVLPPLLAGAAFGFAIAGCLDTAEAYFDDPRRRLPGIISVLRNISAG